MVVDEHVEQKNSRKIGSKSHWFPIQKQWGVGKLNSFGNLIGQSSHVPLLATTYVHFEFVQRKNKSCIRYRSRDLVIYIDYTFESSFSLTPFQRAPHTQHQARSQQKYINFYNEIVIFATLQYSKLCKYIKIVLHI